MARREQDVPGDTIQAILDRYGLLEDEEGDEERFAGAQETPAAPEPQERDQGAAIDSIIDRYGLRPDTTTAEPPPEEPGTVEKVAGQIGGFLTDVGKDVGAGIGRLKSEIMGRPEPTAPERPSPGDLPDTAATRRSVSEAYGHPPPDAPERRELREKAVVPEEERPDQPTVRGDSPTLDALVDMSLSPTAWNQQPREVDDPAFTDYAAESLRRGANLFNRGMGFLTRELGKGVQVVGEPFQQMVGSEGRDPLGLWLAQQGQKIMDQATSDIERLQNNETPQWSFGEAVQDPEKFAEWATGVTLEMLPMAVAAYVSGGSTAIASGGGFMSSMAGAFSPVYGMEAASIEEELKDRGLDDEAASIWGAVGGVPVAIAESAMEAMLGAGAATGFRRQVVEGFVDRLASVSKRTMKGSGIEGLTEGIQELLQAGTETAATGEAPSMDELIHRFVEASAAGTVGGGVFTAGVDIAQRGRPRPTDLLLPDLSEYSNEEIAELISNNVAAHASGRINDRQASRFMRAAQLEMEDRYQAEQAENVPDEPSVIERARDRIAEFFGYVPQEELEAARADAETDPVTGLANRRGEERAKERRAQPENTERYTFKVDLDNFKAINDNLGHEVGDEALVDVARIIQQVTREDDVVVRSRAGGDEFNIVLDIPVDQEPGPVRDRIEQAVNEAMREQPWHEVGGVRVEATVGLDEQDLIQRKEQRGVSVPREEREGAATPPEAPETPPETTEEAPEASEGVTPEDVSGEVAQPTTEAPDVDTETSPGVAADLEQELLTIDLKRPLGEFPDVDLDAIEQNVRRRMRAAEDVEPFEEDLRRIENVRRRRRGEQPLPPPDVSEQPRTDLPDDVPMRSEVGGVVGKETTIKTPDGTRLQARYRAVPISELTGSHNPFTFAQNPAYPENVQDRRYHDDRSAQERIVSIAARFDALEYLDPTIQAAAGPTIIRGDGVILGGYNRYAALARVLENRPERALDFQDTQQAQAEAFGIDPSELEAAWQEEPHVIVREVVDESVSLDSREALANLSAKFNDPVSKSRDAIGDAAVRAGRLEENSEPLEFFFEHISEDQTLRSFLSTAKGRDFVKMLVGHGIITENEAGQFFDRNQEITDAAKEFVERLIDASVITDPEVLAKAPRSYRRQLQKSAPAILQAAQTDGWDIRPEIQRAIVLLTRVQQNDAVDTVEGILQQGSMFAEDNDPHAIALARFLEQESQVNTRKAFVAWAADAAEAQRIMDLRQAGDLFGDAPPLPDPADAFERRFQEKDWDVETGQPPPGLEGGAHGLQERPSLFDAEPEGAFFTQPSDRALEDYSAQDLSRISSDLYHRLQEANDPVFGEELTEEQERQIRHDARLADRELWSRLYGINHPDHPTLPRAGFESVRFASDEARQLADDAGLTRDHFQEVVAEGLRPGSTDGWTTGAVQAIIDLIKNEDVRSFADAVIEQDEQASPVAQEDLFGGAAPAEGGDQFDMFAGTPKQRTKRGLTESERQAAEIVQRLGAARQRRQLTTEERRQLLDARKLLNRSEKFTADEIRDMLRTDEQAGVPQARGQMDAFEANHQLKASMRQNVSPVQDADPDAPAHELRATLPHARRPNVQTAGPGAELPEVSSRKEIIEKLMDTLHVPIRTGKHRWMKGVRGVFKPRPEAIRIKWAQDVEAAAHEAGHYLQILIFGRDLAKTKNGNISAKPFQPWKDELIPLSEDIASPTGVIEGHAEWTRLWLTNYERVQQVAPNYTEHVESVLRESYPDVLEALEWVRKEYATLQDSPAEAQIEAMFGRSARLMELPITDLGRVLYTHIFDQFHPVKQLQEEATGKPARPGEVPLEQDIMTLLRTMHGSAGMAQHWIEQGAVDYHTHNQVGPSFKEILAPVADRLSEWERYAMSRRVLERDAAGYETGFDPEAAEVVVERYHDEPGFQEAFEGVQEFRENLLRYLVDAGALSRRAFNAIMARSNEYIPMFTAPSATDKIRSNVAGSSSVADLFPGVRRFFGSGEQKMRPVDALLQDTYYLIELAHRQRAANALWELSQAEGIGWRIEQVATPLEATPVSVREALDKLRPILYDAEIEGVIGEEQAEETFEALASLPEPVLNELMMIYRPGDYFGERNVISVMTDQGRKWFEVENELLYNALKDIEGGWKPNTTADRVLQEVTLLPALARSLRLGATVLSPIFQFRNPARDVIMSYVQSRHGQVPFVDQVKAAAHWLRKDDMYWKWMRAGGPAVALVDMDRDFMVESIQRFMEGGGRLRYVVKHPIQMGRALSAMMENLSRVAEFERAYEHFRQRNYEGIDEAVAQVRANMLERGATESEADAMAEDARERFEAMADRDAEIQAGADSREPAIDFARHGQTTYALRQASAFWNATIQGHDKMRRSWQEDPVGFSLRAFKAITIPSIVFYYWNRDDPDYWKLPQWVRDFYWVIRIPDFMSDSIQDFLPDLFIGEEGEVSQVFTTWQEAPGGSIYLKLPKPHLPGVMFGSVPERFLEWWDTQDPEGLEQTLGQTIKRELWGLVPFPTGWEPLYENARNRRTFFGSPVVSPGQEGIEAQYQYNESTSMASRMMGDLLDMSPAKLDNVINGWTGSLGRDILKAADFPLRMVADEPTRPALEAADVPVAGGMVTSRTQFYTSNIERFYRELEQLREKHATYRYLLNQGEYDDFAQYQKEHAREIALYQLYEDAAEVLRQTSNVVEYVNTVAADMDPRAKRVLVRRVATQRDLLAKVMIGRRYPEPAEERLAEQIEGYRPAQQRKTARELIEQLQNPGEGQQP